MPFCLSHIHIELSILVLIICSFVHAKAVTGHVWPRRCCRHSPEVTSHTRTPPLEAPLMTWLGSFYKTDRKMVIKWEEQYQYNSIFAIPFKYNNLHLTLTTPILINFGTYRCVSTGSKDVIINRTVGWTCAVIHLSQNQGLSSKDVLEDMEDIVLL